jgi:hypothetical protein
MKIYNSRALWDQISCLEHSWVLHIPYKGKGQLPDPVILGVILAKKHASKIDPQEENKKRTACNLLLLFREDFFWKRGK